jgi:hypothetical protein
MRRKTREEAQEDGNIGDRGSGGCLGKIDDDLIRPGLVYPRTRLPRVYRHDAGVTARGEEMINAG